MAKVTSKLQVTIPRAVAAEYGIEPGDEIEFQPAGDVIRVRPPRPRSGARLSLGERVRLFDEATARQEARNKVRNEVMSQSDDATDDRGWRREELYTRGEPD